MSSIRARSQAGGQRVAGDGADLGALTDEQVDEGASDGAGRSGYQNHLLPSFSSGFSDIVSLLSWVRPEIGSDGLDLSDEQTGWRMATSGPEIPAF